MDLLREDPRAQHVRDAVEVALGVEPAESASLIEDEASASTLRRFLEGGECERFFRVGQGWRQWSDRGNESGRATAARTPRSEKRRQHGARCTPSTHSIAKHRPPTTFIHPKQRDQRC